MKPNRFMNGFCFKMERAGEVMAVDKRMTGQLRLVYFCNLYLCLLYLCYCTELTIRE